MLKLAQRVASFLILATALPIFSTVRAEEPPTPHAPRPAQIMPARKVFISNGGEDQWLDFDPKHDPTLTYNQFYADMKTWGKYELVSSPSAADVVFQIRLGYRDGGMQLRLRILDPQTHVVLWTLNQLAKGANRDATARKNLDEAMNALMESTKKLVAGSP
jgi:hypothetical protein